VFVAPSGLPSAVRLLIKNGKNKAYLRSRKDQNVASSIEDGIRRTARDFDSFVTKNVTMEWEAQQQRIFEHFGLAPKTSTLPEASSNSAFNGEASAFGASSFERSRLGGSVGPGGPASVWAKSSMGGSVLGRSLSRSITETSNTNFQGSLFADVDASRQVEISRQVQLRQQSYARAVKRMNETRLGADPGVGNFSIMKEFSELTGASGNDMVSFLSAPNFEVLTEGCYS
jgi:nuclear pore complex protein Nup93